MVGGDLSEMLSDDKKAEEEAIALYKSYIKLASDANDPVSRLLFEEVLGEEEKHHDTFTKLTVLHDFHGLVAASIAKLPKAI